MNRVIELNKSICSLIELLGGKGIPIVLDQVPEEQNTKEATSSAIQTNVDDEQEAEQGIIKEMPAVNEKCDNQADEETAADIDLPAEIGESEETQVDQSSSSIEGSEELEQLSSAGNNTVIEATEKDTNGVLVTDDDQDNLAARDEKKPGENVKLEVTQKCEQESSQKEDQVQVAEVIPSQETLTRKLDTIDENDDGKLDFEKVVYVAHKFTFTFIF